MTRRQHLPWKTAGASSEQRDSADEVVRRTGWVFNNVRGETLTLADFVATGDEEIGSYLRAFDLESTTGTGRTVVEIGSGIGRMTAGFSRLYGRVYACDLDAAFLERCRETVSQHGGSGRLFTAHVEDGRTLPVPDAVADLAFSYITIQHCQRDDALSLVREAVRATKPGGWVALNFRTWVGRDAILFPLGRVTRALWQVPGIGPWIARRRLATRLGWQANRLAPADVLPEAGRLVDVALYRSPRRAPFALAGADDRTFEGINPSHWWLIGRRAEA